MRRSSVLSIAGVLLVAGCLFPTGSCACDPVPPFMAWIRGVVTYEDGAPAAAAVLRWSTTPANSCAGIELREVASAIADDEGRYSGYITPPGVAEDSTVCVRVVATAGADSAEATGRVRLSRPADAQNMDTLRVSLVLRSRESR